MGDPTLLIIMALAIGAMFLMTSRTRKQQKEAAAFRDNLEAGQEVMTASGLFGTVVSVDDDVVTLETSPGVTTRWLKPAIAKAVTAPVADDEPEPLDVPDDASALTDGDDAADDDKR